MKGKVPLPRGWPEGPTRARQQARATARRHPPRAWGAGMVAGLLTWALASAAVAQPRDPELEWRTIDTPNFTIHYHVPLGHLARRVATVSERAHAVLADYMGYQANRRTHVVLTDDTDSANGSATALPFNVIRLFATAPADMSPLGDYDDWMNLLVVHEHTHIVHLDQWSGVASFINILLGKVYAPNHVQPRFFLEGVATWQESEQTAGGRMRSTMFDMYFRMDAVEDRFFDLDQVSNIADRWPHGNVWYLYGSHFVRFIAERHGREAIATIAREYGDAILPYGLNRVCRRATGRSFEELYVDFIAERRAHYLAQRDAVVANGLVEGRRLTHHGEIARMPRFSSDGRVYYLRDDGRSRPRWQAFDLTRPEDQHTWARTTGGPGASLDPSGAHLYYARADAHRDIYFFQDLFRTEVESGHTERLTDGMRAREPDVSPDGRKIVFTVNDVGTTHLMIADPSDIPGTARLLLESRPYEQVFTPRFSPDGRQVAFSRWEHGGYRNIQVIDVATGELTRVTTDRAQDSGPTWSPDGRTIYFSSDRTGIANIYSHHLITGSVRQITNVIAGAYQPSVSADGQDLVYVGYTSYGFDIFHLPLHDLTPRRALPYVDDRPAPIDRDSVQALTSREYQPLETLWPRAYLLDLGPDGFGPALGINVEGQDLAGWHSYRIRGTTGLIRGNVNSDIFYEYRRSPLTVGARFFRREGPRGGLSIAGESRTWIEEAMGGEARLAYRFPSSFESQTVALTYAVTHIAPAEPFQGPLDPNTPFPSFPETGLFTQLRLSWNYSNLERYVYDISPSNGQSIAIAVSASHPVIGSSFAVAQLTWDFRQFLPMPWGENHVLAFHLAGGISGGDMGRRGTFALGGFPDISPIDGLPNPIVLGGAALRGYPPFDRGGTQYHLAQLEYRLPIWRINRGFATLPFYLNRLYMNVFGDVGDAFFGELNFETFRVGVGGELLLDFTVGFFLPFTLRVGYARGLMEGGDHQVYGHLGVPF